jgi:hypothetical protein
MSDADLKALDRSGKAKALLDNPMFDESFALVRSALLERLENWSLSDTSGAEKLRMMLKLLRDVRANVEQAVRDGKVSQFRLDEERRTLTPKEWAGRD